MIQFFCPSCFAKVSTPHGACPVCGADSKEWVEGHSYPSRLLHALGHPISEVRMAAVIGLGNQGDANASLPLVRCALKYPTDIVLALEITNALKKLPIGSKRDEAISLLKTHPAQAVRQAAGRIPTSH
jgi:HEAT repeat protein